MSQEKKIIIFIVSIFAVFFMLAIGYSYFSSKKINLELSSLNDRIDKNIPAKKEAASSSKAQQVIINEDIRTKGKETITKEFEKYRTAAANDAAQKSVDECAKLFKTETDRNTCVTLWAEYEKNPDLCMKTTDVGRQSCQDRGLSAKAIAEKNISICADIKNDGTRVSCILRTVDMAELSEKDCAPLPANEAKICISRALIVGAKTFEGCDKISDQETKQFCRSSYFVDVVRN